MRLKTRGALAALPLVLALSLAGCGGDDEGGGVASADGGRASSTAGATAGGDPRDMGHKFAQCMRQNGVPMDDPVDGRVQMKNDGSIPRETFDKAQEACRKYSPGANMSPEQAQAAEERRRKHAECMRKNGVEKFPDPQPGQQGIRITGEVAEDPDLQQAEEKCQDLLGGRLGGGPGTPSGGAGGGGQ
jgi:hypothetical protein